MVNTRFTRLNSSNDMEDAISPPPQYFSPEPVQSPAAFANSAYHPHTNGSDYIGREVHSISNFSASSPGGFTQGGSYNSIYPSQDSEKLLKKKQRASSSTVFKRASSSQFFQTVHSGVSKSLAPIFASPWIHELTRKDAAASLPPTVRRFSRHRQRRRILVKGLIQWLVPVTFCGCLAAVMWSYDQKPIISRREKYTFNALLIGFSLCLGFAVASGLKSYAGLLRWRLLAARYREIQDFELLMGCESQTKVLRLIWAAHTPGKWLPNGLQIMCCLYILLMVGLQVAIACLGLTQSVDQSDTIVGTVYGNVSVAYLQAIVSIDYGDKINTETPYGIQGGAANGYGIAAQQYYVAVDYSAAESTLSETIYTNSAGSEYWYYFIDQAPDDNNSLTLVSSRYVTATAKCWQYPITKGQYGDVSVLTYVNTTSGKSYNFNTGDDIATLSSTYYSNMNATCGPRCTETFIFNTGDDDDTVASQFYYCTNTISIVSDIPSDMDTTAVALPDTQARIIAGAIGYSGTHYGASTMQTKNYPVDSPWSWNGDLTIDSTTMAQTIMHFSIGAIAALDQDGVRRNTTGDAPVPAQTVSVIWLWAIVLLALIPGVQLLALLGTVIYANGAVIKDDSFLSAARLLRPIVEKLGGRGCALTGDEIAEALGNYKIIYGCRIPGQMGYDRYGNEDGLMHLDVIEENEGLGKGIEEGWKAGRSMPQGRYDGIESVDEMEKEGLLGDEKAWKRERRRSF